MTSWHELTAVEQGRALAAGELSAVQLAQHYLDRIDRLDPEVHAFVTVTADLAGRQAEAADEALAEARRTGTSLGPLYGVPVAVKDNTAVEDVRLTHGSAAFADHEADLDDHVVTRLRQAGLVILGKTQTPEFALPCYTENRLGPATVNPWDPTRSPGGSSGGSAAAVAAGLVPLAHGTDAGGSVRIPASACGLVGVKPSRGRVSNGPTAHDVTGLSTHGVLARDSADAAALLEVMAGVMPGDTTTAPGLPTAGRARPLSVVVMPEPMLPDLEAHPDCLAAVDHTTKLLLELGHSVEQLEMSPDDGVAEAFADTWSVVAARVELEDPDDEELLMPFTRFMRERGRGVSGERLHAALSTFAGIGQMMADLFFASYDVVLTPTLAQPPTRLGEFTRGAVEAANYDAMTAFMPYTPLANITGLPALSLPLWWNDAGLPIGTMLCGRYGDEATLLALAAQLEEVAGSTTCGRRVSPVRRAAW
jgi:amidase